MDIGKRILELRQAKKLSQGDIQKRVGLSGCYTSRVENGYTVPLPETLEKYAKALEVPLYQFFYSDEGPQVTQIPTPPKSFKQLAKQEHLSMADAKLFFKLKRLLRPLKDSDRKLFLGLAGKMAATKR